MVCNCGSMTAVATYLGLLTKCVERVITNKGDVDCRMSS